MATDANLLEATARLLTASEWRQRVVEKIRPRSADHYELRRSFQFEIRRELVENLPDGDTLQVLLPVCWLPKESLLDFDVTDVSGKSLSVQERRSIAGALAQILHSWRQEIPELGGVELSLERLESICAASLSPWRQALDRAHGRDDLAVAAYVWDATGLELTPSEAQGLLEQGRSLARGAFSLLGRTWKPRELDNTATGGTILVPYMVEKANSATELTALLNKHHNQIAQILEIASRSAEALSWLWILVEAGVRWPVLVPFTAIVDKPFLIKVRELRRSGDDRAQVFRHEADMSAARSYHLQIEAPDPSLRVTEEPTAWTDKGEQVGAPETFESMRWTQELFAVYTSRAERPDRVSVEIKFGLQPTAWLPYAFAAVFVVLAAVAAGMVEVDGATAAVLTIPPALVSGFLVTKDTALVARFLFRPRLVLVLLNIGLWAFVLWKLVLPGIS